jgi:hypothetical protein
MITRLGEQQDYGTYQTEQPLMINGAAKSVGLSNDKLPFPKVSAPTKRSTDIVEYMGFLYGLPCTDEVSNPTELNGAPDFDAGDNDEEQQQQAEETSDDDLADVFGDEFDVEVLLTETGYLEAASEAKNQREINQQLRRLEEDSMAEDTDGDNSAFIHAELLKLLPVGNGRESTSDAFKQLAEKNPWFLL